MLPALQVKNIEENGSQTTGHSKRRILKKPRRRRLQQMISKTTRLEKIDFTLDQVNGNDEYNDWVDFYGVQLMTTVKNNLQDKLPN
jgi:hypothetical protein